MRSLVGIIRRLGANTVRHGANMGTLLLCICLGAFAFMAGRLSQSSEVWRQTMAIVEHRQQIDTEMHEHAMEPGAEFGNLHQSNTPAAASTPLVIHEQERSPQLPAPVAIRSQLLIEGKRASERTRLPKYEKYEKKYDKYDEKHDKYDDISKMKPILRALEHISSGLRYTRSSKARLELMQAYSILKDMLIRRLNRGTSISPLPPRPHVSEKPRSDAEQLEVCPEYWEGNKYGYPYYYTGHMIDKNCTNAAPFNSTLTILIDAISEGGTRPEDLPILLDGLASSYPNMSSIIALRSQAQAKLLTTKPDLKEHAYFKFITPIDEAPAEGEVWKLLLNKVKTKYALVGRRLTHFLPDARLERLVRMLSYVDADVVGGSYRNETGHWQIGCYQTAMRNYAFRLVEGYDQSYNTCVFCDHIGGPFAAKPSKIIPFIQHYMYGNALFTDLFHRMRTRSRDPDSVWLAVCPDSLFFTRDLDVDRQSSTARAEMQTFAQRWDLNTIILPSGRRFDYSCQEAQVQCTWVPGTTMPLCCLRELSTALRLLMRTCTQYNISCELEGGSIVGAVKFRGMLPWERDGDINWDSHDYFKMLNSTVTFQKAGFSLVEETTGVPNVVEYCMGAPDLNQRNVNCGYFALRSENWRLQLYGAIYLANSHFERIGLKHLNFAPTKILLDGEWVRTYPNPVLSARNLYGDNLFEHVEHWLSLGATNEWYTYKTGLSFQSCPRPGMHNCLDQFLPDGNLQFLDVWI